MTSAYAPSTGLLQPPLLSLREAQKRALLKVLSLNSEEEPAQQSNDLLPQPLTGDPVWKFLVFEKLGQDVISSVLRVSDLREAGVMVHMQLKADRPQMEDVPASKSIAYRPCLSVLSLSRRTNSREYQLNS